MSRSKSTEKPVGEKQAIITMSPFKITPFPKTRYVSGLSSAEIKEDLRELHPPSDGNDTDSDSSILSDDILDSVYPVQPRSAPRSALQLQDYLNSSTNVTADEAMYLIREMGKSHHDLIEKEKQREEMEIRCEAFASNLEMERDKFSTARRENENYLKLLQGLLARSIRVHMSHSRQNALLFQMHGSLERLREAEQHVAAESGKLRALQASTKNARGNGKQAPASGVAGSTPVLKVRSAQSGVYVLLRVGMTIPTPVGDGIVDQILPESSKLTIKLPYGIMYAHLPRAVSWLRTAHSVADEENVLPGLDSVHGLQQHYHDVIHPRISLPRAEAVAVRKLLDERRRGDEESGAVTDNDEASEEGSEAGGSTAGSATDAPTQPSQPDSAMEVDSEEEGEAVRVKANTRRSGEPLSTADGCREGEVSAFPLPIVGNAEPSGRSAVKRSLEAERQENYAQALTESLPLVFAPAAAIPHVVAELHERCGAQNALHRQGIEFELHALHSLYPSHPALHGSSAPAPEEHGGQVGATGQLAWAGDIPVLRESLSALEQQIKELESERLAKMSEVEAVRREGAKLTTEAASVRLNMFTRRLAHRTNLSNRGIVLPVAAPAPSNSNKSRGSNQNRSGGMNSSMSNLLSAAAAEANGSGNALALLLAAGESRSSRSKKAASNKSSADDLVRSSGLGADNSDGFARKAQMLRSSADSPFSAAQSVHDEAPSTGEVPAGGFSSRRRGAAMAVPVAVKEEITMLAANKRRAPVGGAGGRRAGDDIAAPSGDIIAAGGEEGDAEENESESEASKADGGKVGGAGGAGKKKSNKRRRY